MFAIKASLLGSAAACHHCENCTPGKTNSDGFSTVERCVPLPFLPVFPRRFLRPSRFARFRAPGRRTSVAPTIATFPDRQTSRKSTCHYRYAPVHASAAHFFLVLTPVSRRCSRAPSPRPPFRPCEFSRGRSYLDLFRQGAIPRESFPIYSQDYPKVVAV